jgi:hypothetical protein
MAGDGGGERAPVRDEKGRRFAISRRQLLIGGGVAAGAATAGWYGSVLIGDGFERHVAGVLGVDDELARAYVERAREQFGGSFEWEALQFVAATRFPGSQLMPAGLREESVRHMVEAMFNITAGRAAYAERITPEQLVQPCPGLGRI